MTLEKSREIIIGLLEKAFQLLPEMMITNCAFPYAENDFREYIGLNELEFALDSIELLGEVNDCPYEFWHSLLEAAKILELDSHQQRYKELILEKYKIEI